MMAVIRKFAIKQKLCSLDNFDSNFNHSRENWKIVFLISTHVDITVYQHGKCLIFLKFKQQNMLHDLHINQ